MPRRSKSEFTRREALAILSSATAGVVAGASGATASDRLLAASEDGTVGKLTVPFFGQHQAGIETPTQSHATFVSFNIRDDVDRESFTRLLRMWTSDMQLLSEGRPAMGDAAPQLAEMPASLTFTVGFGFSLFQKLAITNRWPAKLHALPSYAIDQLESLWCDGDVIVQVCSNNSLTASHAVRELVRGSKPFLVPHWMQIGFNPHARETLVESPRNIMGQVDGSGNPKLNSQDFTDAVWVKESAESWFVNGSTLVLRRIRMALDTWEMLPPETQEQVIGRKRSNGAPLTGKFERDKPDFSAQKNGELIIAKDAHIRRATAPRNIFRRVYNYDSGFLSDGTQDVGLLFASYQADVLQFAEIQQQLAERDHLNKWTTPIGSSLWVIPQGVQPGDWLASGLFV